MNKQLIVLQAIEFANWAHRNQKRKMDDTPYIIHPLHVLILLISHGVNLDNPAELVVAIVTLLHDTREDNPQEVTFELIEEMFGVVVATMVEELTLDPENPDKRLSRKKIGQSTWMLRIVKVADVLSNTISVISLIKRQGLEKTQKCFSQPMTERIQMEREFVNGAYGPHDHFEPLISICKSTLQALDELEAMVQAAAS